MHACTHACIVLPIIEATDDGEASSYVLQVALASAMEVEDRAAEDRGADDEAMEQKEMEDKVGEEVVVVEASMEVEATVTADEPEAIGTSGDAYTCYACKDCVQKAPEYDSGELLHAYAHAPACMHEYAELAALLRLPRCSPHYPRRSPTSSRDHPLTFQNLHLPTCFSRHWYLHAQSARGLIT